MRRGIGAVVTLALAAAWGAAPPAKWRDRTEEEEGEGAAWRARLDRHAEAGGFEEGGKLAERIAAYRRERQGSAHWQAVDRAKEQTRARSKR